MKQAIDLTNVMKKLEKAGLVEHHSDGMSGEFSIEKHSNILNSEELELFMAALHGANPHEECTDLHRWNYKITTHK